MTMHVRLRAAPITPRTIQRILGRHARPYRRKSPYQAAMLNSLLSVWAGAHDALLDVGGGTGLIAQAMAELFPVRRVETIDLVDRFCPTVLVATHHYDGRDMPFADGAFDAATLNNVLHHVAPGARAGLLREIRRVANGPLYIKDHISRGILDDLRLTAMNAIGNIRSGGMLRARYLRASDWDDLAAAAGYRIGARNDGTYRRGTYATIFPNRLEITLRFDPID